MLKEALKKASFFLYFLKKQKGKLLKIVEKIKKIFSLAVVYLKEKGGALCTK